MIEFRGDAAKARARHRLTVRAAFLAAASIAAFSWVYSLAPGSRDGMPLVVVIATGAVAATAVAQGRAGRRIRALRLQVGPEALVHDGWRLAWSDLKYHAVIGDAPARLLLVTIDGPREIADEFERPLHEIRDAIQRHVPSPEPEELARRERLKAAYVDDRGTPLTWPGAAAGAMPFSYAALFGFMAMHAWFFRGADPAMTRVVLGLSALLLLLGAVALLRWPPRRVRTCAVLGREFLIALGPHPRIVWLGAVAQRARALGPRSRICHLVSRNGDRLPIRDARLARALEAAA